MKLAVCLKLVPATTADIRVAADGKSLQLAGLETIISAYDEYALEAALKLRESAAGSSITAFTAGPEECLKCIQHAFALGVDSGVHVKATSIDGATAARAAAALFKDALPDVILCGRQGIDDDQWFFPGALAELLDIPHVTGVSALMLAPDGTSAQCRRRIEGGDQVIEVFLPAVISCDKGLNEPRAPTLKGRLDAKKKQALVKTPAELGISGESSVLRISAYSPPPQKNTGRTIELAPAQAAAEVVRLLREEAKII